MDSNPNAAARIPERLKRLPELANDLWWTWNPRAREVFRRLDYTLWRQTHNPVRILNLVSPEILALAAKDERFLGIYDAAIDALDRAQRAGHLVAPQLPRHQGPIAYFSAEFALHQSLPIMPAASACWQAITARKPAISAFR